MRAALLSSVAASILISTALVALRTARFVGKQEVGQVLAGTQTFTYSLKDGDAAYRSIQPQAGDTVIIVAVSGAAASAARPLSVTGFNQVSQDDALNTSYSTSAVLAWKRMGGTPDTSFTVTCSNVTSSNSIVVTVFVFRDLDAVAPIEAWSKFGHGATGVSGSLVPADVAIAGLKRVAVVMGGTHIGTSSAKSYADPGGYDYFTSFWDGAGVWSDGTNAGMFKRDPAIGTFDPPNVIHSSVTSSNEHIVYTLCLKPAEGVDQPQLALSNLNAYIISDTPNALKVSNLNVYAIGGVRPGNLVMSNLNPYGIGGVMPGMLSLSNLNPYVVYEKKTHVNAVSWRVRITAVQTAFADPSLAKLAMKSSVGGSDLASGRTADAYASSIFSGSYPASYAFDGNASTFWASSGDAPQSVGTFLASGAEIVEIDIQTRPDANVQSPTAGVVEYDPGDGVYIPHWSFTSPATWVNGETRTFTKP